MRRFRPSYGLPAVEHGDRLPAWTERLRSATRALRRARQTGDAAAIARGTEDVWFWVGRLTCDLLSSQDASSPQALAAAAAIMEARRP